MYIDTLSCKESVMENYFSHFSAKTYVVGTKINGLNEHQIHLFKMMDKKIITNLH